jgi:hypothetical protein
MPARKTTNATVPAQDVKAEDLLSFDDVTPAESDSQTPDEGVKEDTAPEQTEEQKTIEALRAELAKAREEVAQSKETARPVPESELTPEQRQIRQLQDELARTRGKSDEVPVEYEENVEGGILIHFLVDGVSAQGRIWYRGQEAVFGPKAYDQTRNRQGQSWLELSEDDQVQRWGVVKFRKGPWPGKKTYEEPGLESKTNHVQAPVVNL